MRSDKRIFAGIWLPRSGRRIAAGLIELTGRDAQISWTVLCQRDLPLAPELAEQWSQAIWAEALPHPVPAVRLVADSRDLVESLLDQAGLRGDALEAVGLLVAPTAGETAPLAARLALKTGWRTVGHFAASDIAAGGMGSCLWAYPAWEKLRDDRLSRLVVHIDALTTLVLVGSGCQADEVVAGTIGPGLCLIDHFGGDPDGAKAARGRPCQPMVNQLLGHHMFDQSLPARIRCADLSGTYRKRVVSMAERCECTGMDLIASLTEMSAQLVARAARKLTERPHQVVLAGPGAENITLAGRVRELMSPSSTIAAGTVGIDARCFPAAAAARLASLRIDAAGVWCPSATGSICPAELGTVFRCPAGGGR
ncbi:MAG: anhydro-N-acetylmuramic acid kinase [Phycisphaerae bacterium]